MTINSYPSTIELKNKLSKQEEQRENHGYGECFDDCQVGRQYGGMDEDVKGLKRTNRQLQNSPGDMKYSVGNGVATELIFMTRGHEQWWGDCLREWRALGGAGKEGKSGQQ